MDDDFRADVLASTVVHSDRWSLGRVTLPEARNRHVWNAPARLRDHTCSAGPGVVHT